MLIYSESQKRKHRLSPAWPWLGLLAAPLILPAALLALAYNRPLDFQVGNTAALVMVTHDASGWNSPSGYERMDVPGLKNLDYPINGRVYRLQGTAHTWGYWSGTCRLDLGWCRGRRVK